MTIYIIPWTGHQTLCMRSHSKAKRNKWTWFTLPILPAYIPSII
uniref:Uncharacterized protein n=1 Tax=Arundo donax TaxID=35708 RepID=A0A0A9EVE7_ARUDO